MSDRELEEVLDRARRGELSSDELLEHVYETLRGIAAARMASERAEHTLEATALVHEAWIKLFPSGNLPLWGRSQFFAAAAEAMRRVLLDHARSKGRAKRGGGRGRLSLDVLDLAASGESDEILALDEAICRLEGEHPDAAAIVRLRFFAGLSVAETARTLGSSPRSVDRTWAFARAWLHRELQNES